MTLSVQREKDDGLLESPVLLTLDLFQETEQCSKQAADDRRRVTGLCAVESEHALETAYVPLSMAMQIR